MYSEKQLEYFKRMLEEGKYKSDKQREYFERVIGMKQEIEGELLREVGVSCVPMMKEIGIQVGGSEGRKEKKREYMRQYRKKKKESV